MSRILSGSSSCSARTDRSSLLMLSLLFVAVLSAFVVISFSDDTCLSSGSSDDTVSLNDEIYRVTFISDGEVYEEYNKAYGGTVTLPSVPPTRASDGTFDYKFDCWYDYENNKVVTGDMIYTAQYTAVVVNPPAVTTDGIVKIEPKTVNAVTIGAVMMSQIKSLPDAKTISITLPNGKIEMPITAIGTVSSDTAVSIKTADTSKYSEDLVKKIGTAPAFSVVFGDVHEFKENIKVFLKYSLKDGEDSSTLKVWYLKDASSYESIGCSYSDGYVVFSVSHLSDFAVVHEEPSVAEAGYSVLVVVIGAVAAVIVLAVFAYIIKKKTNEL